MADLTLGLQSTPPDRPFTKLCFTGLGEADDGDKLQSCVLALEEERKKIEVFRRELPLCMQLMNDAIDALKSHLAGVSSKSPRVFEEFISSKPDESGSRRGGSIDLEKPSWMAEAQLWTSSPERENPSSTLKPQAQRLVLSPGAFSPFVRRTTNTGSSCEEPSVSDSPSPVQQQKHHEQQHHENQAEPDKNTSSNKESSIPNSSGAISNQRKLRRCWSAELHRRFLDALEQLGGSQVATPKLIREIMKIDGLTNDEVKSHLQKYRLHTRRPVQRSEAPAPVVILVPAEYAQQKCSVSGLSTFFTQQNQQQQQQRSEAMEVEKPQNPSSSSSSSELAQEQVHQGEIDDDGDVTETEDSSGTTTKRGVDEAEPEIPKAES